MTRNMETNQQLALAQYDEWERRRSSTPPPPPAARIDGRSARKVRRLEREALRVRFHHLVLRLGTVQAQRLLMDVRRRARSLSVQP